MWCYLLSVITLEAYGWDNASRSILLLFQSLQGSVGSYQAEENGWIQCGGFPFILFCIALTEIRTQAACDQHRPHSQECNHSVSAGNAIFKYPMHFQSQHVLCLSCGWKHPSGVRMPVSGKCFMGQVVSGYAASPMMYMPTSFLLKPYILLWKDLSSFCQFPYSRCRTLAFPGCPV